MPVSPRYRGQYTSIAASMYAISSVRVIVELFRSPCSRASSASCPAARYAQCVVATCDGCTHVCDAYAGVSHESGLGRCLIAHTLKSTHIATALWLVVKLTIVDELSRFTDAEQWLIVAFVTLMVVVLTCWVGLAVVLVTRTVVSAARFVTRKIRGLAGRADSARAAAGQLFALRAD